MGHDTDFKERMTLAIPDRKGALQEVDSLGEAKRAVGASSVTDWMDPGALGLTQSACVLLNASGRQLGVVFR